MEIITKAEAIKQGFKRYWTGKPCKNNHISYRYLSGGCSKCDSIKQKLNPRERKGIKRKDSQKNWWRTIDRAYRMILKQRSRAKERDLEFSITEKDINPLPIMCPILEIELDYYSSINGAHNTASIDRIDNSKGYIPGNVQIISSLANRIKKDVTILQLEKLLTYMKRSTI